MSRDDVEEALRDAGFSATAAERVSLVGFKAWIAASRLDSEQLALARSHPVGHAVLRLAQFYGDHDGPTTRSDFLPEATEPDEPGLDGEGVGARA